MYIADILGLNTDLAEAIANAHEALASASAAIASQSAKQYVLTVTDETTAKQTVGTTVKQLEQDLRDTHASLLLAKQAVMLAARELGKAKKTETNFFRRHGMIAHNSHRH